MKLAIIGGDARQRYCAELLHERGHEIRLYRPKGESPRGLFLAQEPKEAIRDAEAVLFPIPVTRGKDLIAGTAIAPEEVLSMLEGGTHLLGGNLSSSLTASARRLGIVTHDYLELESFVLRNAYLTAQAALGLLLTELSVCLYRTPVAVIGFGRIAKFLARMLVSLGAEVTVFARKPYDRAMASLIGMRAEPTDGIARSPALCRARAIVNTAPARLLSEEVLSALSPDTLLFELASGTDNLPIPSGKNGIRLLLAQGLPGKYFPYSAGEIVADATEEFLKRSENREG